MMFGGPASDDFGTRTISLRVPFGPSANSGRYSSTIINKALVIMLDTIGCLVISFHRGSVLGLNDLDNIIRRRIWSIRFRLTSCRSWTASYELIRFVL